MKRMKIIVALVALISMTAIADDASAQRRNNNFNNEGRQHNDGFNNRHNQRGAYRFEDRRVRHFGNDRFGRHHRHHRMMAMRHRFHDRHRNDRW